MDRDLLKHHCSFVFNLSMAMSGLLSLTGLLSLSSLSIAAISTITGPIALSVLILTLSLTKPNISREEKKHIVISYGVGIPLYAAIGFGLATAITPVLPTPPILPLAVIVTGLMGLMTLFLGLIVANFLVMPIIEKVDEYITSPKIERFSQTERQV